MHFTTDQTWEVDNPSLRSLAMNDGLSSRRFYPMVEMFLMLAVFVVEIESDCPVEGESFISNLFVSNFRQLLLVLKTTNADDSSRVLSIHLLRKHDDVGSGEPKFSVSKVVEIREGESTSGAALMELECSDGSCHDGFMSACTGEALENVHRLFPVNVPG